MNVSISLTRELADRINARIGSGRYASASDVVQAALRLLEENDRHTTMQHALLRGAWVEGIESEDAGPLDFAALKAEARRHLAARAKGPRTIHQTARARAVGPAVFDEGIAAEPPSDC